MALLRIERTPVSYANLGLLGFDHLQLVLQPEAYDPRATQDGWYVLEGVFEPTGHLGVEGSNGVTTLADANGGLTGSALIAAIGTPSSRGSRVIATDNALQAWSVMSAMAREIDAQAFPYIGFSLPGSATPIVTSTSVIASLLYWAGFDIAQSWPSGIGFSPGWTTLLGTRANDYLVIERGFTSILAGWGNDTVEGSNDGRVDKLYGGVGNDKFKWSTGTNYLHGGQPGLAYADDGIDTVSYIGAGTVVVTGNENFVPHKTANFTADFVGGRDYLFSIERLEWADATDNIILKDGANLLRDGLKMTLGGQASGGHGDALDLSDQLNAVLVNATPDQVLTIVEDQHAGEEKGLWVDGAEWLTTTKGDDRIYASGGLHGIEAGDGGDIVDTREVTAFSNASPRGYDVEIDGGAGNDTLIANAGHTLLHGGEGADRFILSGLTSGAGTVEIVIDDADVTDRLLLPHNLFDGSGLGLEGSALMPVLGGIGTWSDLQDGLLVAFDWRTQSQIWYGSDLSQGLIRFIGEIEFTLEGSDLLVHIFSGDLYSGVGPNGTILSPVFDPDSETIVRIVGYQPGDLGLQFFDPGTPDFRDLGDPYGFVLDFPGWDAAVQVLTNNGQLEDALPSRPVALPTSPDEEQQQRDDRPKVQGDGTSETIVLALPQVVDAAGGNDTILGSSGDDVIDGGNGADSMRGGAGNDSYVVDNAGDVVTEAASEGRDDVSSSISYALTANVEDLTLTGTAAFGTGNGADNRLVGNGGDNALDGGAGNDVLSGEGGNDTLVGGAGSDVVVYSLGDGRDVVTGAAVVGEVDRLALHDIAPAALAMMRVASAPNDLVLRFADGGSVTLAGYFAGGGSAIQEVVFDDGTVWSAADIALRAALVTTSTALPLLAIDDPYLLAAKAQLVIPTASLLANDVNASGLPVAIIAVQSESGGTVSLRADGDIDFVAPASGATTFTYTISDGNSQATARATIAYEPNSAPVVQAAVPAAQATEGEAFTFVVPVTTFGDANSDPLQVTAKLAGGAALPAWLVFDAATWSFAGTPPVSGSGAAAALDIVLTASDGLEATATTMHLVIAPPFNSAPVAAADVLTVEEGLVLPIALSTLLANDSDPDGDALTLTQVTAATHGTLTQVAGGGLQFAPDARYVGPATFGYTISDGHGHAASATVTINVTASPGRTYGGTTGNDVLDGTTGADTLTGGAGDDVMHGWGGNDVFTVAGLSTGYDVFDGGGGNDKILGSSGDDAIGLANVVGALTGIETIDGGGGTDTLRGTAFADSIDLSAITVVNVELIDAAAGNDTVIGSAGNDTIKGNAGDDVLRGGAGDDTFLVQGNLSGADVFDGGAGTDTILGTASADIIVLAAVASALTSIERIDGGAGTDILRGSASADTLDLSAVTLVSVEQIDGAAGNDTLIGSLGNDTLTGGAGNDTFVMRPGYGRDVISDFQLGTTAVPLADVVDVTAWGYHTLADVLSHATTTAGSVVITYNATTSLTLTGILQSQLHADDFRFA